MHASVFLLVASLVGPILAAPLPGYERNAIYNPAVERRSEPSVSSFVRDILKRSPIIEVLPSLEETKRRGLKGPPGGRRDAIKGPPGGRRDAIKGPPGGRRDAIKGPPGGRRDPIKGPPGGRRDPIKGPPGGE